MFLADGGHFDNTAVLPLLKRKCRRIIAVDSEDNREVPPLRHMLDMALSELGVTFRLGNSHRQISSSALEFVENKHLSLHTNFYYPELEREVDHKYSLLLSSVNVPFERALQVCGECGSPDDRCRISFGQG